MLADLITYCYDGERINDFAFMVVIAGSGLLLYLHHFHVKVDTLVNEPDAS